MRRRVALAALAWPLTVPAQARPLLGILSPASPELAVFALVNRPFMDTLEKLGYEIGKNIDVAERFAHRDEARLAALAAELVKMRPAVLL